MTNPSFTSPSRGGPDRQRAQDQPSTRRDRSIPATLGIAALAIIIAGALIVTFAQTDQPTEASVSDILARPTAFEGDRVVSEGEIDEFLTDRTLVMAGERERDAGLLVLVRPTALVAGYPSSQPAPLPVSELLERDDPVMVRGTVDAFDRAEMSDELGIVLHPQLFGGWDGRPSVVVDRIDLARPVDRPA